MAETLYTNNKPKVDKFLDSISEETIERQHSFIKRTFIRYVRKTREHEKQGL